MDQEDEISLDRAERLVCSLTDGMFTDSGKELRKTILIPGKAIDLSSSEGRELKQAIEMVLGSAHLCEEVILDSDKVTTIAANSANTLTDNKIRTLRDLRRRYELKGESAIPINCLLDYETVWEKKKYALTELQMGDLAKAFEATMEFEKIKGMDKALAHLCARIRSITKLPIFSPEHRKRISEIYQEAVNERNKVAMTDISMEEEPKSWRAGAEILRRVIESIIREQARGSHAPNR